MVSNKLWVVINVSLVFIALLLALNLFDVKMPTFGKAQYWLDSEQPLCGVKWQSNYRQWNDLDYCCLEARKQLDCTREIRDLSFGRVDWWCHTGSDTTVSYVLNNKAYSYCKQLSIW